MHNRGVSRPMDRQAVEEEQSQASGPDEVIESHHRHVLWIPWTVILLGLWLATAPWTFGHLDEASWMQPSGGRGAWFSDGTHDSLRAGLVTWSDVISGGLLVVLGWRMLRAHRPVSTWAACLVGVWLVFAPVVLWSPTAAAYANDSLVGILVIALTILVPGMPNMPRFMVMGPDTPPGWSYNPSSWAQRSILIGLGFAGLLVSRYLAGFQLGYVDSLWDPFFGFAEGTGQVLNSEMSHMWPVSDAALGAVAYTFEFLMGYMGGTARWRTMPWMVTIFGILVIPLGLAHIVLVMSQPVVVHAWCTGCLLAAAIMLPMIPLELDEVVAMGHHLRDARRRGDRGGSMWKVFWLGGEPGDLEPDERSPGLAELPERPGTVAAASVWGVTAPAGLVGSGVVGVAILAAPSVFGVDIRSGAADVAHIGGAAILVLAAVATAELVRALRLANAAVGIVLALAVWATGPDAAYAAAVTVLGVAAAGLSLPRGSIRERYGDLDRLMR